MFKISSLFASLLFSCGSSVAERIPYGTTISADPVDHVAWEVLLRKHVDLEGNVDYGNFAKDSVPLKNYLHYLAQHVPAKTASKEERLAYYINLYNAGTVQLIIANYPVKSIKDIRNPWDKKTLLLGKEAFSLGEIEHEVLRKMNEPRIHFAINCASYSCPKLINRAYTAAQMEKQLEEAAISFINDPKRNRISATKAEVSEIFNWFKKDFTEKGTLAAYINQYAKVPVDEKVKMTYLPYDWSLNESK